MKRQWWFHGFMVIMSLITAMLMLSVPYNRFEWMLHDPLLATEGLNYCGLPLDDSEPALESFFYLFPALLIALAASIRSAKRIHPAVWYAAGLLALWIFRFFIFAPHCPGRSSF